MERTQSEADGLAPEPSPHPEPVRRHPARIAVASVSAIVLVAAAIGVVATSGDDSSRPRLVLDPYGSSPAKESPAAAGDASGGGGRAGGSSPYRFRFTVAASDLGSDAPVARLEAPKADDARIAAMAAALGLHGNVSGSAGGSRQVTDGTTRLTLDPVPGGWAVSYGPDFDTASPGSVPGSSGSGSSDSGTTGSGGSSEPNPVDDSTGVTTERPPETKTDPGVTVRPTVPATTPPPAANLPEPAEAERVARALLDRMGVTGEWAATTMESARAGAACAPEPCAEPMPIVATTLTVELRPLLDRVAVDGLSWQLTIGDDGNVVNVYGTWTTLRALDRYPLRTVASVFADLEAGKGMSPVPDSIDAADLGTIEPGVVEPGVVEPGAAKPGAPTPEIAAGPIDITIDHVALGFTVFPASDNGVAVVDVVPTYVFSGPMSGGGEFTQALIAVDATFVPPADPVTPQTKPTDVAPPTGPPEPQPAPAPDAPDATVSGKPPT